MKLDLKAEVQLDASIQFSPLNNPHQAPRQVFLTGASGFLGVYLLDTLLRKTQATVHCLIRCTTEQEGYQRLQAHLQFYCLWNESHAERIKIIHGDLAQPLLGLSPNRFEQLAEQIDVIYHSAAQVNSFYSYAALKATNVQGTHEILRLAAQHHSKPLHCMSTLAVFFSPPHLQAQQVKETDVPSEELKGGYKQSKWVAEALVREAQARGLTASLYRTARIMGDTRTGINGNTQDFLCSMLRACIHLQQVPEVDTSLNMIPVDFASDAIIALALQSQYNPPAFHLYNPISTHWNSVYAALEEVGYRLTKVPFTHWLDALKQATQADPRNKVFAPVSFLLRSPTFLFAEKPPFDDAQTQQALKFLQLKCTEVDAELLKLYLTYFKNSGFF